MKEPWRLEEVLVTITRALECTCAAQVKVAETAHFVCVSPQ